MTVAAFDEGKSRGDSNSKSLSSTFVMNSVSEGYSGDDWGVGQKKSIENQGQYGIQQMASTFELLERRRVSPKVLP